MPEFKFEYEAYFKSEMKSGDEFLAFYDQIDIVDFTYSRELELFTYPCPCGDVFTISLDDLRTGETIARCNSCSLLVQVVYSEGDVAKYG